MRANNKCFQFKIEEILYFCLFWKWTRTYRTQAFATRTVDGRRCSIVVCVPHKMHKVQLISLSFYGQRCRWPQCADRKSGHDTRNTLALLTANTRTMNVRERALFVFCFFLLFVRFCSVCSFGGDFVVVVGVVAQMESMKSIQSSLHSTYQPHSHAEHLLMIHESA